jgi:hypothetical protein
MDHPLPSREENIQRGHELTAQAEAAEQRSDYASALARYDELRSLPDYARPQDLEQRVRSVRTRMMVWPPPASQPAL